MTRERYLLFVLTVGVLFVAIGGVWLVLDSSFDTPTSASSGTVEFSVVPGEPPNIVRENPAATTGVSFNVVR